MPTTGHRIPLSQSRSLGQRQQGFTLVELVTVITIMAIIAAYITVKLGSTSDDAKLNMAKTVLTRDIPQAIINVRSRNGLNCAVLGDDEDNFVKVGTISTKPTGWTAVDAGDSSGATRTVAAQLVELGGAGRLTPWGETWAAAYDHSSRTVAVAYPFVSVADADWAKDLEIHIRQAGTISAVQWLNNSYSTYGFGTIPADLLTAVKTAGSAYVENRTILIAYQCI
jgi:prepilin-type N-terminal cleavage/methylation domain-containing protein